VALVRRQDDAGEAMPREFAGLEDDRTVEQRHEALHAVRARIVWVRMQLDRAAPRWVPLLVEIDQYVDAPMQHPSLVDVEIDMDVKPLAVAVLVRAAPKKRRIGDQVRDSGERAHRVEERRGADVVVESAVLRADRRHALDHGLATDGAVLVQGGEIAQQRFTNVLVQEILDGHVRKRPRAPKFALDVVGAQLNVGGDHGSGKRWGRRVCRGRARLFGRVTAAHMIRLEPADCRQLFRSSRRLLFISELDEGPQRGRDNGYLAPR